MSIRNYIKTDYFRTVLFGKANMLVNIIIGIVFYPIIVKKLGLEALGLYSLFFSMKTTLEAFIGWMGGSFIKEYIVNKDKTERDKVLSLSFSLYSIYLFFFGLIAYLPAFKLPKDFTVIAPPFFAFLMVSFASRPLFEFFSGTNRQAIPAQHRSFQQIFLLVLGLGLLNFFPDILLLLWLIVAISAASLVVLIHRFSSTYKFKFNFIEMKSRFRRIVIESGHRYMLYASSFMILQQIDIILITALHGPKEAGIFSVVWKIPNSLIQLGVRYTGPLANIFADKVESRAANTSYIFRKSERYIFLFSLVCSAGYYLTIDLFMAIWMPEFEFRDLFYQKEILASLVATQILAGLYEHIIYHSKYVYHLTCGILFVVAIKGLAIVFFWDKLFVMTGLAAWLVAVISFYLIYTKILANKAINKSRRV